MAVLLAEELGVPRTAVPPFAGNFSAWGLLGADMVQSAARTLVATLDETGLRAADAVLADLFGELGRRGARLDAAKASARFDLRHRGQEHSLALEVPLDGLRIGTRPEALRASFAEEYRKTFGGALAQPWRSWPCARPCRRARSIPA